MVVLNVRHNKMYRTYKYRLLTKARDYKILESLLEPQRVLYNCALAERKYAYHMHRKSLSLYDQQKELTECRKLFGDMSNVPAVLQRGTLARLDRAYKSFFRRIKNGEKPGFPRFKGKGQFKTLEWNEFAGIIFDGKHIKSKAFGSIRVHLHRPLEGTIKTVRLVKDIKGWHVAFSVQLETPKKQSVSNPIGVDVGLEMFVTLSNGEKIPSLRIARKNERKLRIANRALSRCKKDSNRRKKVCNNLAKVYVKIKNTRKTYAHQISATLVKQYDLIVAENLQIKNMLKSSYLAKSINDASWAQLLQFIEYKAENAGTHFVRVDPRYTSQDCSECGERTPKKLTDRIHVCMNCGLVLDRDVNAAKNILNKVVLNLGGHKVSHETELVSCEYQFEGKLN